MSILAILGWIKEAAVVIAIGWVVWFLYHSGGSAERAKELSALNQQITQNAEQSAKAQARVQADIQDINGRIDARTSPVVVHIPRAVPNAPKAAGSPPASGGSDEGPGIDIRPGVNAFEKKYEDALAQCRGLLESWPK